MSFELEMKKLILVIFISFFCLGWNSWQGLAPSSNNFKAASGVYVQPLDYPPTAGATEVWNWGEATTDYTTEVQAQEYTEGSGGTPGHQYEQSGPPGSNMAAIVWRNDGSFNSHHTAPDTAGGQSSGAVDTDYLPDTSSFKFYFLMKSGNGADTSYFFFDYDQQSNASTFTSGMQFFVATAGTFAPASLVAILKDDAGNLAEFHGKTGGTTLFEDDAWHMVEMIFDKTHTLPTFKVDGRKLAVINTFSGPALNALGAINPANGIRFGMREYSETATGRAYLTMAAAAYSKDLTYTWR